MEKIDEKLKAFNVLCSALDGAGVVYGAQKDTLSVFAKVVWNGHSIDVFAGVNADAGVLSFCAYAPLAVPQEKRLHVAVAIAEINFKLLDGSFNLNYDDGTLLFYAPTTFDGCELKPEHIGYKFGLACAQAAKFADAFKNICENDLSLADAVKLVREVA